MHWRMLLVDDDERPEEDPKIRRLTTTTFTMNMLRALLLVLSVVSTQAFVSPNGAVSKSTSRAQHLFMAPKWDGSQWVATSPEEEASAGYGAGKSLLIHGPLPFINRVFQAGQYEQGVLKFMAGDKCSRDEAQGNMDAYLANPNDWAFNRFEEERRGFKMNYTTINSEQVTLTLTWSALVAACAGRAVFALQTGENFWAFLF